MTLYGKGEAYVHKTKAVDNLIGPPFEILSERSFKHYEVLREKGENVYIDDLTYEEFMLLGDVELSKRFISIEEKEQKEELNKAQGNELEFAEDTGNNKAQDTAIVGKKRVKFKGEDTIINRLAHWEYSDEQIEAMKKALKSGISKEKVLEWFYPEVSVKEMERHLGLA